MRDITRREGERPVNAQYNLAKPGSLAIKIAGYQRRKMFGCFVRCMEIKEADTILDIGVTSDRSYDHSNYLEAWYPHKNRIIAVGVDNAGWVELEYPGMSFVKANGCDLPFANNTFDFTHSSAVIEHVGSRSQQARFLGEAWRVARKGVFVTTPNSGYPVEFHTMLPLIHWLPVSLYRKMLLALGYGFFADEKNLNLLSCRSLSRIARAAGIERFRISSVSLLGFPTNLLLMAHKPARKQ